MSRTDDRFERLLSDALEQTAPGGVPQDLLARLEAAVDGTRRRPRWLAVLREPTMRLGSTLVVGSVAVRASALLAAIVLLALALAGVGVAGSRLIASAEPIIVDPDGNGTVTTIGEAIDLAADGDTILVRPGTYVEAVLVDRDITIRGDGEADEIIVRAPQDGPTTTLAANRGAPYAILLQDSSASVAGLTLQGLGSAVHISGGQPTLEGLVFEDAGEPHTQSHGRGAFTDAVVIANGSRATVRDNELLGGGAITIYERSQALVIGNTLVDGPSILSFRGDAGTVIRDNQIVAPLNRAIGAFGGSPTIEGNVIEQATSDGITVGFGFSVGTDPIVRDNHISGTMHGIAVAPDAHPLIERNTLRSNDTGLIFASNSNDLVAADNVLIDNTTGIALGRTTARIEGNSISGGKAGIVAVDGSSPILIGNTVEGADYRGVAIVGRSTAVLEDNRICGNASNLVVLDGGDIQIDDSNEICEDGTGA